MGQARGSDLPRQVERMIAPAIESMGFEVVRVALSGGRSPVLQVMVEHADGAPMTVDDCAGLSRAISALLDAEPPAPRTRSRANTPSRSPRRAWTGRSLRRATSSATKDSRPRSRHASPWTAGAASRGGSPVARTESSRSRHPRARRNFRSRTYTAPSSSSPTRSCTRINAKLRK